MNTIKTQKQAKKFGAERAKLFFDAVDPNQIYETEPLPEDWCEFDDRIENGVPESLRDKLERAFRRGFGDRLRRLFNLWGADRPCANHCP